VQDQLDNLATFLVTENFFHKTLPAEIFSYIVLNNPDALLRPKITYDIVNGFEIQVGANVFLGAEGQLGQFAENNLIFAKLIYNF